VISVYFGSKRILSGQKHNHRRMRLSVRTGSSEYPTTPELCPLGQFLCHPCWLKIEERTATGGGVNQNLCESKEGGEEIRLPANDTKPPRQNPGWGPACRETDLILVIVGAVATVIALVFDL